VPVAKAYAEKAADEFDYDRHPSAWYFVPLALGYTDLPLSRLVVNLLASLPYSSTGGQARACPRQ
jgi:hypothetical protein